MDKQERLLLKQFRDYSERKGFNFSIKPLTLTFHDRVIEKDFRNSYFQNNLQLGRACHLAAVLFYVLVSLWDTIVTDPSRLTIWVWVVSLVSLIFLIGLVLSFVALNYYAKYWQQLFAFYVLMTGIGFTVASIVSSPNYPIYNFVGIIFCLFFCYTFIRLRFVLATAAGNAIVAFYTIGVIVFVDPPLKILLSGFFYTFGINLLGMMVSYSLELMSRRDFMLNKRLKHAENKTKDMNVQLEWTIKERTKELVKTNQDLTIAIQREKNLVAKIEKEEEVLKKSLNSLQQAESIAKLGYFERNWQTGEGYWSKGFSMLLGYEDTIGVLTHDEFVEFIHEKDKTLYLEHIQNALKNHAPIDIEFRLIQKNGNIIQIHGIADNFYSPDDTPLITRGIFQDITDYKQTQNKLKKLEGQLIQAQKMESVGRLAGGVAHDYNNISSIIIGYSELALEQLDKEDPLREDLEEILTAAKRSTDITRQLLAFARKQTIAPKVLDLNDTIGSLLKILQRLIGEDIDLAWLPGSEVWPVKIDPSQIDQILANLAVNARDAISDVGKVTIETKNISFDEDYCADHAGFVPGEYVLLAVSDDGSGIAPDILNKIFEPFFTTKGTGKGTGLGLSTVYGIVKQNHGFINVYSEPKKGTTIKIYLPRHEGRDVEAYSDNNTKTPLSRGETVLLVEDDGSILKLGKRILGELGYRVLSANSPSEATRLVEEQAMEINLLITDVIMPEMNGRELSKQLKSLCLNLKTLFMSGYTANVIAHRGVLDDDVAFISKPFSKKDMAVKVREVLDETKGCA